MASKKRYRRARKSTPLKEMGFITVLLAAAITFSLRQSMEDPNLGLVVSVFFFLALFLGVCLYFWLVYGQHRRRR